MNMNYLLKIIKMMITLKWSKITSKITTHTIRYYFTQGNYYEYQLFNGKISSCFTLLKSKTSIVSKITSFFTINLLYII